MNNIQAIVSTSYFFPVLLLSTWFSTVMVNSVVNEPGKFGLFCFYKRKAILWSIAALFAIEFLIRNA